MSAVPLRGRSGRARAFGQPAQRPAAGCFGRTRRGPLLVNRLTIEQHARNFGAARQFSRLLSMLEVMVRIQLGVEVSMREFPARVVDIRNLIGVSVALGLAACGTTSPPPADLTAAEAAVEQAGDADAAERAPEPFTLAQDKLARAREAAEQEDHTTARRLAEQAEVDARLAAATARSEIAKARAAELRESIRLLREEIERQRPRTS